MLFECRPFQLILSPMPDDDSRDDSALKGVTCAIIGPINAFEWRNHVRNKPILYIYLME